MNRHSHLKSIFKVNESVLPELQTCLNSKFISKSKTKLIVPSACLIADKTQTVLKQKIPVLWQMLAFC